MTIIAGFRSSDGVVICADTQETIGGISKRNVPKLTFEEPIPGSDLAVAFCGATNNGPFMDNIIERAWERAKKSKSFASACSAIEKSITKSYEEFGRIYQPGYCPEAELIYGVKMSGQSKLCYALGPAINEKKKYATGGAGLYMAEFLARRMYKQHLSVRQCVILAAYVLFVAKENVDGCGGDSNIAVLRENGISGMLDARRVDAITQLTKYADESFGEILIQAADMSMNDAELSKRVHSAIQSLTAVRESEIEAFRENSAFWDYLMRRDPQDELGLTSQDDS